MAQFVIVDHDDPRFPDHTCIACFEDDGRMSSISWAPYDIDPAVRIGPEMPVAIDARKATETTEIAYRVPTIDEYRTLNGVKGRDYRDPEPGEPGKDHHRVVATYAAVLEVVTVDDAATACQIDKAELVAEAEAWAVARDLPPKKPR